jgi:hypothetical protein
MVVFLLASVTVFTGGAAYAARCGDDVDGRRVACACGDVLVSDARLLPTDPVVAKRCEGDGLIVRAPVGAPSLRLDLGGQTLLGAGRGTGVRVLRGGEGGCAIVGGAGGEKGVVAAFGTGLRAGDLDAVREVQNVDFSGNARDGVYLRSKSAAVSGLRAERNGRDGLRIGGRTPRIHDVDARENGRYGVHVTAREAEVDGARSRANRRADFRGHTGAQAAGAPR